MYVFTYVYIYIYVKYFYKCIAMINYIYNYVCMYVSVHVSVIRRTNHIDQLVCVPITLGVAKMVESNTKGRVGFPLRIRSVMFPTMLMSIWFNTPSFVQSMKSTTCKSPTATWGVWINKCWNYL